MPTKTPPPPRAAKVEPPTREQTRGNLSAPDPGQIVALNFRVPSEVKKDFKVTAAVHGITQSQLLVRAFREWKSRNS